MSLLFQLDELAADTNRYPPMAPIPVAMKDDSLPVSHYFTDSTSNAQMVSISIWLDRTAAAAMPRPVDVSTHLPPFKYPMDFSIPETPAPIRRIRQRPSTAPAAVESGSSDPMSASTSGFRSLSSLRDSRAPTSESPAATTRNAHPFGRSRVASPLANAGVPRVQRGLGITSIDTDFGRLTNATSSVYGVSRSNTLPRGSVSASDCSTDDGRVPSLNFSQLSLTVDPADPENSGPLTPELTEREGYEWLEAPQAACGGKQKDATTGQRRMRKFAF